jgi:1-acyl-sn-glycerol-3-phosphate acyltransferase
MNEDTTIMANEYASESVGVSQMFSDERTDLLPFSLRIQRAVGFVLMIPFCVLLVILMRFWRRYHIENLSEIRKQFRELTLSPEPILVCANHLTFIDSAIMLWAMASIPWYLFHYRFFSWNLPAGDFFKKKFIYRLIAYLGKCIFIHRDGTREHKNAVLDLCRKLLKSGEVVSVFPEGRRSRSGRFDITQLTKGSGKLVATVPRCRVLCVYLRGDKQTTFTNYPAKGSRFSIKMELLSPVVTKSGREAYAEITDQIASRIKEMEDAYFSGRKAHS